MSRSPQRKAASPAAADELAATFADAADGLDLALEDGESWPPWGLVAAAAHGPVAVADPPDTSPEDDAVRAAVMAYGDLDARRLETEEEIAACVEEWKAVTTDPFYCIEPSETYSISHLQLPNHLRARNEFVDGFAQAPGDTPPEISDDRIWYINPLLASVTLRAQMAARDGGLFLANVMLVVKKTDTWRVHMVAHSIELRT